MEKLPYERPIIQVLHTGIANKFGTRTEYEPVTHIDRVAVADLLDEFGSPLFVFSEQTIRRNYQNALRAFETRYPKVQFAWSYKTNYLNAVCRVFHQEGSWAEVVSRFEYDKARANGVPGRKILFNGPDKTNDDLRTAIRNDSPIHIDHLDELYRLVEIARESNARSARTGDGDASRRKPRVAIRVNMDTGVYPMWDRFGFNYENGQAWDAISKILTVGELDLVGLHTHIGTYMLSPSAYRVAAGKMADLAMGIKRKFNKRLSYLDLGGGFASRNTLKGAYLKGTDTVPDISEYAEAITTPL
jgi:diaminopimelate decarboxylase